MNINEWYETDGDCLQHCKDLGDRCYHFIEAVWLDSDNGNEYAIVESVVDLKDFSLNDIECAVSSYYGSIAEMEQSYNMPFGQLDQLIAECYFEESCIGDSNSLGGTYTWDEAKEVIKRFMEEH